MPDLSDNVNWSEVDANNNQAPPNGWPEGMMPSGVNDAARADRGAMKRFWNKLNPVQSITSSGGVYTFVTGNAAYPAAYVEGEIYSFLPAAASVGGDQFQVNALGPKPILKHFQPGPTGWIPIVAFDLRGGQPAEVVYRAALNAGAGAFALINPVLPIQNDGTGIGVSVPSLTVYNPATPSDFIVQSDGGFRATTRYIGLAAPSAHIWGVGLEPTAGNFVVNDATTNNIRLQIDTVGNATVNGQLTVGAPTAQATPTLGDINAQRVFSNGQLVTGGDGSGNANISGNASVGGTLGVTGTTTLGNASVGGTLGVTGTTTLGNASVGGTLNVTGTSTLTGAVTSPNQIQAENLRSIGDSYIGGTLYANTGVVQGENLRSLGDSYIGNNLYVTGLINGVLVGTSSSIHKHEINPIVNDQCLAMVNQVEPVSFRYRDPTETDTGRVHWGFTVEDLMEVTDKLGLRFDAFYRQADGTHGLAYMELIAVLWGAVKELSKRLDAIHE